MLDRIAGRLWSVKFQGASEIMELGGMRYIEEHHRLLHHYVNKLKLPAVKFLMGGNLLQDNSLRAYLRNDRYRQNEWDQLQQQGQKLYTAYRVTDELIGMTAFQMITFAVYLVFRAPYNQTVMEELNDYKNDESYYQSRIYKS